MAAAGEPLAHHFHDLDQQKDSAKLGMWVFLSSEFLFFGALITNYLLFKGRDFGPGALYPVELYDIPFTSISESTSENGRASTTRPARTGPIPGRLSSSSTVTGRLPTNSMCLKKLGWAT